MKFQLTKLFLLPLLAATVAGCTIDSGDENTGLIAAEPGLSAAEVGQLLGLVNDWSTGLSTLDDDARLNARAAESIVVHRAGEDGLFPSDDDVVFDSLEELDALPYVGPAAIGTLADYASNQPPPSTELVEGVQFGGTEALAIVWGVNNATVDELDHEVGLDARAAAELVAGAPYQSVSEMGAIKYVGPSALNKLGSAAVSWFHHLSGQPCGFAGEFDGVSFDEATAFDAIWLANESTFDEMVANGIRSAGANRIIAERSYENLEEVASVKGVGKVTMQQLHAYATSLAMAQQHD